MDMGMEGYVDHEIEQWSSAPEAEGQISGLKYYCR